MASTVIHGLEIQDEDILICDTSLGRGVYQNHEMIISLEGFPHPLLQKHSVERLYEKIIDHLKIESGFPSVFWHIDGDTWEDDEFPKYLEKRKQ